MYKIFELYVLKSAQICAYTYGLKFLMQKKVVQNAKICNVFDKKYTSKYKKNLIRQELEKEYKN